MAKKSVIYVFGNPLLPEDSQPLKLIPELRKKFPQIVFQAADPNESLKPVDREMIIIDTAASIKKVTMLSDTDRIVTDNKIYSAHDLDLGFNLKLLKKLGQLEKAIIFCVPMKIKKTEALRQLAALIKKTV
jgi:Ni,Fe-hydrogenase maturation factor